MRIMYRMSSDQEFQRLRLEKQDLERSLEEQADRVANAFDRMKKAEEYANECQIELGKVRVDSSELDCINVSCVVDVFSPFLFFTPTLCLGEPREPSERTQRLYR